MESLEEAERSIAGADGLSRRPVMRGDGATGSAGVVDKTRPREWKAHGSHRAKLYVGQRYCIA